MLETLQNLDSQIYLFFNGMHTPFLDNFMMMFTGRFIWVPMYATILFILFKNFKPSHAIVYTMAIVLTIAFADQICATYMRPFIGRLRPSHIDNPLSQFSHLVNGYRGGNYGFPSCHAANSFALATFLAMLIRRRRFVVFIMSWAILNSYSRLYLGVHYPGDLLVGATIGSLIGYAVYIITQRILSGHHHIVTDDRTMKLPFVANITDGILNLRASDTMIGIGAVTVLFIIWGAFFG